MMNLDSVNLHDDRMMMRPELLAAGYDGRAITRMCRSGVLHRLRHGAYVGGELWRGLPPLEQRRLVARAVLRSARSPVALCGPSAADELGAPVWDLGEEVHVARLDRRAGRREAGVVQHRGGVLVGDLTVREGLPVTSGTRTAIDLIALADTERALVTSTASSAPRRPASS